MCLLEQVVPHLAVVLVLHQPQEIRDPRVRPTLCFFVKGQDRRGFLSTISKGPAFLLKLFLRFCIFLTLHKRLVKGLWGWSSKTSPWWWPPVNGFIFICSMASPVLPSVGDYPFCAHLKDANKSTLLSAHLICSLALMAEEAFPAPLVREPAVLSIYNSA